MYAVQRSIDDHVAQHFHRIVLDDADVGDLLLAHHLEQISYAGCMHFQTKVVVSGIRLCDRCGAVAHAEADFQYLGRSAAKGLCQV